MHDLQGYIGAHPEISTIDREAIYTQIKVFKKLKEKCNACAQICAYYYKKLPSDPAYKEAVAQYVKKEMTEFDSSKDIYIRGGFSAVKFSDEYTTAHAAYYRIFKDEDGKCKPPRFTPV